MRSLRVVIIIFIALVIWLGFGFYVSGFDINNLAKDLLSKKFIDLEWWVESTITFTIFTLIFNELISFKKNRDEKEFRKPYEGWSLISIYKQEKEEQELYWDEVMRFEQSDFERWKFVKSIASGVVIINLRTVKMAEEAEWVMMDKDKKTIIVDLDKAVKSGHADLKKSSDNKSPDNESPDSVAK